MSTIARTASLVITGLLMLTGLTACGTAAPSSGSGKTQVVTAFYPLTYVVENIGGSLVSLTDLTPAGGEAHELELSPSQVNEIGKAQMVVYLGGGFQPSVDQAIAVQSAPSVDVLAAVSQDKLLDGDPHVWLDPQIMGEIGLQVAESLTESDPANAETYTANAASFLAQMSELDQQYATALKSCAGATLVTSHEAFGYLAAAYGLEQVGVTGINPDAEPSPKRLNEVAAVIKTNDVTTLFFEKSTAAATESELAESLGVKSAQLNPLEGRPTDGVDYFQAMQENLQALQAGLNCG